MSQLQQSKHTSAQVVVYLEPVSGDTGTASHNGIMIHMGGHLSAHTLQRQLGSNRKTSRRTRQ